MDLIITIKFLEDHDACLEGIKFFKNNFPKTLFPKGLDLSKVKINGDHHYYFEWLNDLPVLEYDENKNVIKRTYSDGNIYRFKYDKNNNLIKKIFLNGKNCSYKYDDNNNLIIETLFDKRIQYYEYDKRGNKIKETLPYERNCYYEYDERNNLIKKIYPNGTVWIYSFKYDKLGRLVQVEDCYITYLD